MNREERQVLIRAAVIKVEAIDKSLPAHEAIAKANEIIVELELTLFPNQA